MKIGILTTFDEINSGAYLQAYALQNFLKISGYDSYFINYKTLNYFLKEWKIYLLQKNPIRLVENIGKILKFKSDHRKFKKTKFSFSVNNIHKENFDVIIMGSDEIWNFSNCIGADIPAFSSYGLKAKKFISYAPSFGSVSIDSEFPHYIVKGVKQINHLSVRDENSLKILKDKFNRSNVKLVLDPTFLYDFDNELDIIPRIIRGNYILVYGFFDQQTMNEIKAISHKMNVQTISVFYFNSNCDKNMMMISPFEWLNLIKNASYVVTNMYHGTIFSLKFKKKIALQVTPYRKNKIETLINIFGLEELVLRDDNNIAQIFEKNVNYNEIHKKIDRYKKESMKYLLDGING